jgi:cytochrome P450
MPTGTSSVTNYLTVYKDPFRDVFIEEARTTKPFFDRATRAWIVADPELCREMLVSEHLHPAPAMEHYRNMPNGLATQFESVAFAFDHIPLCLADEAHGALRRRTSEHIASRRHEIHQWMTVRMPRFVDPFTRPGRFDVAQLVLGPMVRELIGVIAGVDLPLSIDIEKGSQIFDKSISMSRRINLAEDVAALQNHIRSALGPDATDDDVGMRLGLVVVGHDATLGTLAESLSRLFHEAEGQRLSEIAFPKFAPQTGVPFVERIAASAFTAAGIDFEAGARVRIILQTFSHSPPDTHHRFFGAGAHACLGRPVSTELWRAYAAELAKLSTRVEVRSYELATDNYVFNVAKRFEVEVTA